MRILLILAHPNKESFNHAIAKAAIEALNQNGHEVLLHDLYDEQFDPVVSSNEIAKDATMPDEIKTHCKDIAEVEGIIIIHPNWWGQPPAVLKGWIDRVIRPGIAYEFIENDKGEGIPKGLLKATSAVVFNTSNTESKREKEVFGDPLKTIWKNCVFGLCGVKDFHRRMFNVVVTSSNEQRSEWLAEVKQIVNDCYPKINSKS